MSKRVYNNVIWRNKYKNTVDVKYTDWSPGGVEHSVTTTVNRYEYDGDTETTIHTKIFSKILEQWPLEKIDQETEEHEKQKALQREADDRKKKEEEEYNRIRKVFETKIEIFNIPEISESSNREMKAKIRRSKTSTEAIINSLMLLLKESDNDLQQSSTKE